MLEEILMCETLDAWSQVLFSLAKDCGFSSVLFGVKPTISTPFSSSTIISNSRAESRQHAVISGIRSGLVTP